VAAVRAGGAGVPVVGPGDAARAAVGRDGAVVGAGDAALMGIRRVVSGGGDPRRRVEGGLRITTVRTVVGIPTEGRGRFADHHASPGWRRGLGLHCFMGHRWSLVGRLKGLAPIYPNS